MKNFCIGNVFLHYMEKPIHLLVPIITTFIIMIVSCPLFLHWAHYEIITYCLLWFSVVFVVSGAYLRIREKSIIEEEYNNALEEPFKQKFIIPKSDLYKINYEKQTDEIQRKDKIEIPSNTKATIILRTRIKEELDLNLEIIDSQYNFGGKGKKPEIIKYSNPYYKRKTSLTKWFEKELDENLYILACPARTGEV